MKAVKTIAALIFLAALAIVLVQPILGADDAPPVKRKAATPTEPPEPPAVEEDVALTARYPKRCMRPTREPASGLVAARRGSIAEIGFPDLRPVARIEVSGDVAWSPSGTFLAERGGRVFDQSGNPQGALFFEPREWQWSPVADCALATTERGSLTYSIPDTPRKGIRLLNAPVKDFELSPNGRRLAAVIEDGGLWIADLRRGRLVQATEGPASIAGWFSNRSVLYSKSPGKGKLRHATGGGKTAVVRNAFAGGALLRCAGRAVLVGGSTKLSPLVELRSRRGRITRSILAVTGDYDGYTSATCSPDGAALAVSTVVRDEKGPLVLLEADGTFVRELMPGKTANPQWSDEGLMFVRFGNAGRGQLWMIAPGASAPQPTAYRVGAPTQYDWHVR